MARPNLITLTTDFGLQDAYVGEIKGAILRRNLNVTIIDLTHAIDVHDIRTAAMTIRSSYHYFPTGTVHMIVVDPGVGSQRNILAMLADDHIFIAPDNGTLTFLIRDRKIRSLHRVANSSLFPDEISATFHGRDIMAPIAAALAGGLNIAEVGPPISIEECVQLKVPKNELDERGITGSVIHIDRFGNIKTTITSGDLGLYQPTEFAGIVLCSHVIDTLSSTYSDAAEGELVAVVDSSGHLEIAVNRGSAAKKIGCAIGDPVTVAMAREK
ncbi:MAG: SAM-dependent chlorinase/fluorinase [Desulfobulbaceae bacterium]|nr:SAM-dependent chlorinase/fluorinase [Desulfobulbaceae bacterium]